MRTVILFIVTSQLIDWRTNVNTRASAWSRINYKLCVKQPCPLFHTQNAQTSHAFRGGPKHFIRFESLSIVFNSYAYFTFICFESNKNTPGLRMAGNINNRLLRNQEKGPLDFWRKPFV